MKDIFVSPDCKRVFMCDCGNMLLPDNSTKCKHCGAWYKVTVERVDK